MPEKSERLRKLPPYVFAVIADRLRQLQIAGKDIIRLDIGDPDMPPPEHVVEAVAESARQPGNHGYSGYKGTASFREAVAVYYQTRFSVKINPETQVLPLLGSKEGIVNLCLAYLEPGAVSLTPDISYPAYAMGTMLAHGDIHWLPLSAETGYLPEFGSVKSEVVRSAKLLWLNYPNNPTGAIADRDFYGRAVDFCNRNDLLLASDNPYVDVTFDGYSAPSALEVDGALDCSVEFISFSKTYNMAGWRLGAAVGSAEAIKTLLQVKSNIDSGHFKAVYDAGIAALKTPHSWIEERNCVYQNRRDRVMAALPEIGLEAEKPCASLYVWAKVLHGDALGYIDRALDEAHVSLAPGSAYGPGGDGYIRLSLGTPDARLDEALARLKTWYANGR
jgi:LL-diaminopimelate aminotransferase